MGLKGLIDEVLRLPGRCAANAGSKLLTLVMSGLLGGSHIDHTDRLRAASTAQVLGFKVKAPSTVGSFLREFTEENITQLDEISERASRRVHTLLRRGAPRHTGVVYLDVDSTICEVQGRQKQGATAAWTNQVGYHPLVATRSDTSEIVMTMLRPGSSQENNTEFITEAVRRLRRCSNSDRLW